MLPTVEHPEYPYEPDARLTAWYRACGPSARAAETVAEAAERAASVASPGDVIVGFCQIHRRGEDLAEAVVTCLERA